MVHWLVWGSVGLTSRLLHNVGHNYYNMYITNGFNNCLVNIYLFAIVFTTKLIVNPVFYFDKTLIIFGVTSTIYPYWVNKANELIPHSPYPLLITHTDPIILTAISPIIFGSSNRIAMLFPIYCMTIAKLLIIYYDNPYSRIAMDEESLQEELQQPLLHDRVLSNIHIGFSAMSLGCIVGKDVSLGIMANDGIAISDILLMHQAFAVFFSLFYKFYKNVAVGLIYIDDEPTRQEHIIPVVILFNNDLIKFLYIFSLYNCYLDIPNNGYAKLFMNFYIPLLWCLKLEMNERHCNEYYISSYYCYFLSLFGLLYFGR